MSEHVAIIGNGIAGITAARFIRKLSDKRITVISDETDYFYSRPALMYLYMGHMTVEDVKPYEDWFWEKNRIDLVRGYVEHVNVDRQVLHLRDGDIIEYDTLLVATGSVPRSLGVPGEDLEGVQNFYGMSDLRQMEANTQDIDRAVVVGGGLTGIELAEMLHTRHIPVTFLVRETSYYDVVLPPEESKMVNRVIREHGVDLRLGSELRAIQGDSQGRVRSVVTDDGEEIPCQFVAIAIGVQPNTTVVEGTPIETNRGVLVNEHLETSVPDIYAAGDCTEFREEGIGHRRIDQLWYTGRREGRAVAQVICNRRRPYDSGVFFNSAKFFTIEYQVYGDVKPELGEGEATICWQDPDRNESIRINYREDNGRVLGFNLMGVRYRHAVCEQWIREGRPIEEVLAHLPEANFDPEFSDRHERALIETYNARHAGVAVPLPEQEGLFASWFG